MTLDYETLVFASVSSRCAYAVIFIVSAMRRRSAKYFWHWSASIILSIVGLVLSANGQIYLIVGPAQGFVIYGIFGASIALCWSGTRVFLGKSVLWKRLIGQALLPGVLFAAIRLSGGEPRHALAASFVGLSWLIGRAIAELLMAGLRERLPSLLLAMFALVLYLLTFLAFIVSFPMSDRFVLDPWLGILSLVVDQSCSILIYIGFLAMAGERSAMRLERLATTDPLTHLANRRGVLDSAHMTGLAPLRHERPISVLLADVDRFKEVNDRYGHEAGDVVLKEFARRFRDVLRRRGDVVARWGGEEFLAVLHDVPAEQAAVLAEKIRRATEAEGFVHGAISMTITVSVGVAAVAPDETTVAGAIQRADRALYTAKESGRNRVCVSP